MKNKKKLALYVHIPFCVQKCLYCDFLSAKASTVQKDEYIEALLAEVEAWKKVICSDYKIETVFIGGGTPTCLSAEQLLRVCSGINSLLEHNSKESLEYTIEANPGTITKEHIQVFQNIGISRVSMGLQSAQNQELKALGRIHSYEDFVKSYALLRKGGIQNINIDLMSDIPLQTKESYEDTIKKVLALEPEHISSYSLIIEPGTPFYEMNQRNELFIPDEDSDRDMYDRTKQLLEEKGYIRYEISNYARDGKECKHNLTYWKMDEYLGIGLGASSYFNGYRFQNETNLKKYVLSQKTDTETTDDFEKMMPQNMDNELAGDFKRMLSQMESVKKESKRDAMEEFVFLGLRMREGISKSEYQNRFGYSFDSVYKKELSSLFAKKLLAEKQNHDRIYLTDMGIDVSNMVLSEFLLEDTV